jgi:hypothetical protein
MQEAKNATVKGMPTSMRRQWPHEKQMPECGSDHNWVENITGYAMQIDAWNKWKRVAGIG